MGSSNLISVGVTLNDLRRAVQKLASNKIGEGSSPTFGGLALTGLTANRLISSNANKALVSSDLYSWVTETSNQVLIADDGDGTITFSTPQNIHTAATPTFAGLTLSSIASEATDVDKFLVDSTGVIKYRTGAEVLSDIGASPTTHRHDTETLEHDAVNSDGGAFSFTTTGLVTFNQSIASANYTAANLFTACATNAGALDFSAASKTLTVEDDAIVSQDYSVDASPTFASLNLTTNTGLLLVDSGVFLADDGTENTRLGEGTSNGDIAADNTFIGYHAGFNNDDSTPIAEANGTRNIYIGSRAGAGETGGSDNSGAENVAIGESALRMNTIGYENTAVGDETLQFNTTGHGNCAFGNDALQGIPGTPITGNFNTGIGTDTLYVITSGEYNTAVGYQALYSVATQSYNTAVGYQAGLLSNQSNQSVFGYLAGYQNTGDNQAAFGLSAGYQNTGIDQAAFGRSAGQENTGSSQAVFGYFAGYQNTGDNQAAFGYWAGRENTGADQTVYGRSAGYQNTGGSQVALGFLAGYQNTGNNQTVFGYWAGRENTGAEQTAFGRSGGYKNIGVNQTAAGYFAGEQNKGAGQTVCGYFAGRQNLGGDNAAFGYLAGWRNEGDDNTAVGSKAFNTFPLDAANAKAVDTTDHTTERMTINGGHGFGANGTFRHLRVTTTGVLPAGLSAGPHIWEIISSTVVECKTDTFTDNGSGTHTLTPRFVYSNSTAVGHNAEPDASNQIVLGDTNVTQIKSAATLYLTRDANNYIAGNLGLGVIDPDAQLQVVGDCKFGDETNDLLISATGDLSFTGTATIFNDIVISLSAAKVPAANAPTWSNFISNLKAYTYDLNDFQEFTSEIAHSYKEGSTIEFHVHGATNGLEGVDKTIKFEIEYELVDNLTSGSFGDAYTGTTTISGEITISAATTDKTSWVISIGTDATGNFLQGATLVGRIRRIASTGTEPAADPFVMQVGVHIEEDTVGSRTEQTK